MSYSAVLTCALLAAPLLQDSLIGQYRAADRDGRMRVLSDAVQGRTPATEAAIRELLQVGIQDGDTSVRAAAVGTIASILQLNAMPVTGPGTEWAVRLRLVGESLREDLERLTSDPEVRIRREALRGIIGSAYVPIAREAVPLPVAQRLARIYESDPDPGIRAMAVQTLRYGHRSDVPEVKAIALRVMLRALAETDGGVVQNAGWSAFESKDPQAIPLLIKQLNNPSPAARMGVAAGLQAYRGQLTPYLPQLEAAFANEPEGPGKKTLEAAIKLAKTGK